MFKIDVESDQILDVNNSAIISYGYSRDDFLSMTLWDIFLPEDIKRVKLEWNKEDSNNTDNIYDWGIWQHLKGDGELIYVHIFGQKIQLNGRPARLISMNIVNDFVAAKQNISKLNQRLLFQIQNSPLAFIETTNEFNILQWSDKASNIFGWNRDEVIGKNYFNINMVFEDDLPLVSEKFEALQNGEITNFSLQNRNRTKDGRIIFCEWYNSCFFDGYGQVKSILSQVQDITQQKKAENELQKERDFNRQLINSLPGTFYLINTSGRFVRWNKNLEKITGYSPDEISEMKPTDFFDGTEKETASEKVNEVFSVGKSSFEGNLRLKDGKHIPFFFTGHKLKQNNQDFIIGIGIDISNRHKALSELRDAKNLFEKTFMNLDEAVLIINPASMQIMKCNSAVKNILGYDIDELIGKTTNLLYQNDHNFQYFTGLIIKTIKEGKIFHSKFQLKRKDGQIIQTEHSVTPLNEDGHWEDGLVCIIRDITEKNRYEEELRIKDSAIESALNAIVLFNMDGSLSYANPAFLKMWDLPKDDEFPKVSFKDLWINPSEIGHVISLLDQNEQWTGELIGAKQDGSSFNVLLSANIVKNDLGDPICMMASITDITDQKNALEELEESQRMLSTLMGNLPGMAYRCANDENWTMQFASGGCFALTGYLPHELEGNKAISFADLILPEDREMVWNEVQSAISANKPYKLTYRIQTADNNIKWVWEKGRMVTLPNSEIRLEGFITDVTERIQASEELKRNEELFSGIFQNSPVGIVMVDEYNNIKMVNEGFCNIFNYSSYEIIGKNVDKLLIPEDRYEERKIFTNSDGGYKQIETIRLAKDGKPVSVLVYGVPIFLNNTQIADFGIYVDISERKKAESKVHESLKEKEVLLAEIHHRVKNNLAIISGLLELQANTTDNDHAQNILRESQTRIKSIAMIHEKLYHSETLSNIAFDEYLESLLKNIVSIYKDHKKNVEVVTNTEQVTLNINQAIPFALLTNEIIVNSYKHAFVDKNEGKIWITMKLKDDRVVFKVHDNGVGIPDDFNVLKTKSLGMRLISTLSKQLNADLCMRNEGGLLTEITFDIERN